MTADVRVAGRAILADGRSITWTAADGGRGRRWRIAVAGESGPDRGLLVGLIEVDVQGRIARLELSSASGLLTLHPEPSGGLHGNVVTASGVRHLSLEWSEAHELEIAGLPITAAITARRLARSVPVGEGSAVSIVTVDQDLGVHEGQRRFERVSETDWRIIVGDVATLLRIDERGVPAWGGGSAEWPLELESQP